MDTLIDVYRASLMRIHKRIFILIRRLGAPRQRERNPYSGFPDILFEHVRPQVSLHMCNVT